MHYINWPKYFNTSLAQSIKDKICFLVAIVVLKEQASPNGISAVPNIGQLLIRGRSPFAHLPDQILRKPPSLVLKILFYATAQIQVHATCDTWLSLMCDAVRLLAAAPEEDT